MVLANIVIVLLPIIDIIITVFVVSIQNARACNIVTV